MPALPTHVTDRLSQRAPAPMRANVLLGSCLIFRPLQPLRTPTCSGQSRLTTRAGAARATDSVVSAAAAVAVLPGTTCTDVGGQGRDRTADLPLFRLTFGLHHCVSAGQSGPKPPNWAAGAPSPVVWPHFGPMETSDATGDAPGAGSAVPPRRRRSAPSGELGTRRTAYLSSDLLDANETAWAFPARSPRPVALSAQVNSVGCFGC